MNRDELLDQLGFYRKLVEEQGDVIEGLRKSIDDMRQDNKESQNYNKKLLKQVADLTEKLDKALSTISSLEKRLSDMTERNDLNNQHRFGSNSQKGITKKIASRMPDRAEQKDDFSNPDDIDPDMNIEPVEEGESQSGFHGKNALGPHKKMEASRKVFHKSDISRIPAGAVFIGFETRKRFDEVYYIVEHDYQLVKYKTADGRIELAYLPPVEEKHQEMLKSFPGTHASTELLSNLIVNKYQICTPLHRELTRMLAHNMSLSEKTLTNWLDKVSKFLYKMLPALKAKALEAGTAVNCDETWCRVRISDKYTKKYIWCLVNRQTKSVLFFYDNGSRGRQVLTDFLGSAEIVALQSDGYNAYTFLDNELTDIEHMMTVERKRSSYAGLLPTGRKNSLMFGSHKGAEMSAIFHTFIETCKINGISTIEYFKKLLSELLTGNNNYVSLLPQTIGIKR